MHNFAGTTIGNMKKLKTLMMLIACAALLAVSGSFTISATSGNKPEPQDTVKSKASFTWLDFESGYAKAKTEKKILLIDVYTDWCGWCKVMDRTTYSNAEVIEKLNASFVMVKLNPEKERTYVFGDKTMTSGELHRWLGYGRTYGYPTTYFMVAPGTNEDRYAAEGYLEPEEFIKILDQVLAK